MADFVSQSQVEKQKIHHFQQFNMNYLLLIWLIFVELSRAKLVVQLFQNNFTFNLKPYANSFESFSIDGQMFIPSNLACEQIDVDSFIPPIVIILLKQNSDCSAYKQNFIALKSNPAAIIFVSQQKNLNISLSKLNKKTPYFQMQFKDYKNLVNKLQELKLNTQFDIVYAKIVNQEKESQQTIEIELWTAAFDQKSYEAYLMFKEFVTQYPNMEERIKWKPRMAVIGSVYDYDQENEDQQPNIIPYCICKNKYCPSQLQGQKNDKVITEQLREIVIFQNYPDKFFDYIRMFKQQCLQNRKLTCSLDVQSKLKINIQDKVQTAKKYCYGNLIQLLDRDYQDFKKHNTYPLILVNNKIASTQKYKFTNFMCKKYSCQSIEIDAKKSQGVGFWVYFFLFVLIISIIVLIFLYYKRKMQKEYINDLRMNVDSAVENYFQLAK